VPRKGENVGIHQPNAKLPCSVYRRGGTGGKVWEAKKVEEKTAWRTIGEIDGRGRHREGK